MHTVCRLCNSDACYSCTWLSLIVSVLKLVTAALAISGSGVIHVMLSAQAVSECSDLGFCAVSFFCIMPTCIGGDEEVDQESKDEEEGQKDEEQPSEELHVKVDISDDGPVESERTPSVERTPAKKAEERSQSFESTQKKCAVADIEESLNKRSKSVPAETRSLEEQQCHILDLVQKKQYDAVLTACDGIRRSIPDSRRLRVMRVEEEMQDAVKKLDFALAALKKKEMVMLVAELDQATAPHDDKERVLRLELQQAVSHQQYEDAHRLQLELTTLLAHKEKSDPVKLFQKLLI